MLRRNNNQCNQCFVNSDVSSDKDSELKGYDILST